jgi:aconitate hydratase
MGILPLQFAPGESVESLGLSGREVFDIEGLSTAIETGFAAGHTLNVVARRDDGSRTAFQATIRIDTPQEVLYYQHGGILQYVLRQLLLGRQKAPAISAGPATTSGSRPNAKKVEEGSLESFPASDPPAY